MVLGKGGGGVRAVSTNTLVTTVDTQIKRYTTIDLYECCD